MKGRTIAVMLVVVAFAGASAFAVETVFQPPFQTSSQTSNQTSITTSIQTSIQPPTYKVTFEQTGACTPEFWGIPWSVTIDGNTKVQPPNTQLPLNNGGPVSGTTNSSFTTMVFSLPNGHYPFEVSPSYNFFTPDSGVVNVTGSDVTVLIAYTGTSCATASQTKPEVP